MGVTDLSTASITLQACSTLDPTICEHCTTDYIRTSDGTEGASCRERWVRRQIC